MSTQRIYFTCTSCGSMDLRWDAYVAWNIHKQINEEAGDFDSCFCVNCGGETSCNQHAVGLNDRLYTVKAVELNASAHSFEAEVVCETAVEAVRQALDIFTSGCVSDPLREFGEIETSWVEIGHE